MHYKKIILALTAAGMIASQTVPAYAEENSNVTSVSSASGVVSASSGSDAASASTSGTVSSSQNSSGAVSSSSAGNTSSGAVETPENSASGDNATSSSTGSGATASGSSATGTSGENASVTNPSGGTDSTKEAASGNADAAGKNQSDASDKKSTEVSDATKSQAEQEAERAAQNEQSIQPVVPAGVAGTVDQTAAEKETFAYLTEVVGLNNAAASGLLANFYQETMFQYKAVGGNGIAYGLAQWTGGNFTSLANWCGANGRDYTTIDGQMYYLKYDLETNNPTVYAYLKGLPNTAEGAGAAAAFFCTYYERPAV